MGGSSMLTFEILEVQGDDQVVETFVGVVKDDSVLL